MAAPSGTVWGNEVTGSKSTRKGKIGIYAGVSTSATTVTVTIQTWFWSMYSIEDVNNSYYYNGNATTATTLIGKVSINHTVATGSGWSTSNQTKLGEAKYTYTRGTSAYTKSFAAKLTGIDNLYSSSVMSASVTITIPALSTYKISYNANGGSGAPNAQTKYYGKNLTLSSTKPTRSGYTFDGWSDSSNGSKKWDAGGIYTWNQACTLYARWKKTITLTYDANGGSGAPSSQSATVYNATTSYDFALSSTTPTRIGYTFLGWSTSDSASSATYSAGDSITLSASDVLYAVWKVNSYTLIVNPNGGVWDGTELNTQITENYNKIIDIPIPTWTGHTFTGWTLSGYGTLGSTEAIVTTYKYGAGAGTLTAKWDTNDYSVTFDASTNGGSMSSGTETETKSIEYGSKIGTLPTAVKKNHTFLGWFTDDGVQISSDYIVTGNITLYAQYEIDTSIYVNEETVWESGVAYVNDASGNPKKGHAKVNVNGKWRDGLCN